MPNAQFIQLGPFWSSNALATSPKLYHYSAGTTTDKDIWSDRAESTTLAQPFIGDANGVFNFFADGLYKLVIKDSADNTLYTLDNVLIQDFSQPSLAEGDAIPSGQTTALGDEVIAHITGTTDIEAFSGAIPFFWAVFDGSLTLVHSSNLLCPGDVNLTVQPDDVLFFIREDSAGTMWRVAGQLPNSLLVNRTDVAVVVSDARTDTVDFPLTVTSTTSGTPAVGIGTGVKCQAESADENPSDAGAWDFKFLNISSGAERSVFDILLRVGGAALAEVWRWAATVANRGICTHANTADRTYTFPDVTYAIDAGDIYKGPSSIGSGSTRTIETFTSGTGNLNGIHFYSGAFTLDNGHTLTVQAGNRRVAIISDTSITINGTITAAGAGGAAGAGNGAGTGAAGGAGTDQPGGGGGGNGQTGGAGGAVLIHGITRQAGGAGGASASGSAGSQLSGSNVPLFLDALTALGGAGGGGAGGGTGVDGGAGGGSIILIAPTITLGATAVLNTSGVSGQGGSNPGGGGGGAGNIYIITRSYTDSGATFTMTGGAGGGATTEVGGAGATGVKQILIYA